MTREMEEKLLGCRDLSEFLAMFWGLGMREKLSAFPNKITIKEGTTLFRVRKAKEGMDPSNPKEWEPVPAKFANQGRFNKKGESVLYVATAPDVLEREIDLKEGEKYYLAHYICRNDFSVGNFLGINSRVNTLLHKIALSIYRTDELTESENTLIEKYYREKASRKTLYELSEDDLAPLYIHKMIPNLYDVTNKLGEILLKKNEYGFRYSSAYTPIELSGYSKILTLNGVEYGNYALSRKGYENLEYKHIDEKTCGKITGMDTMIEVFLEE